MPELSGRLVWEGGPMTFGEQSRLKEIKDEMAALTRRRSELNTQLQALQAELASRERGKLIESAKAKRRRTCLVLELHLGGMTLGQVAQRVGMSVHTVTGYIYQSEGHYSYELKIHRPDGHGRATFWREHKLEMALSNLQLATRSLMLGAKLEDVKELPDEQHTTT
jgi:AraC-like DNA-binding protein